MPKISISTLHMRGWLVFQSHDGPQAVGGLQEFDSPDVSLRIFLMSDALTKRPYLRLCANFATRRSEQTDEERGKHDVNFDFYSNSVQEFRLLDADETTGPLPESLVRDCTFFRRTFWQRLRVQYDDMHVTGLEEALQAADTEQSAALLVLAKLPSNGSFTFYKRRKQAFRRLIENMSRALTKSTEQAGQARESRL